MKVQIISSLYVERDTDGGMVGRHRRGAIVELKGDAAKAAIEGGFARKADEEGELPPPNAAAVIAAPTQPDGTPLTHDAEGNELVAGALTQADETQAPKTHAEADAKLAELGIAVPKGAKVSDKADAIRAYLNAQAAGETPATTEDLNELSDEELIQRAVDYGHSEEEVVELSHDELVLFVAEAMNRQSADPAGQAERTAELAARRDASDDED